MGADGDSEVFRELDKRWKITSKLLFGGEVGPLSDYADWLSKRADAVFHEKSSFSGKEVSFGFGQYCTGSRRISFDEADLGKKFAPIPINSLKDIDSIAQALSERFAYAGNMILGNSGYIEKSANVSDSYYVLGSSRIGDSKYIAYSSMGRACDHVFGTAAPGDSSYLIRCNDTFHVKRAFELWMTANCSDCYYTHNMASCTDCMFSFNLKNKRHAIGNLELEPDKYRSIKSALVSQIAGELKRKKSVPSLIEIASGALPAPAPPVLKAGKPQATSMAPIEEGFAKTCELLFGSRLAGGIDAYSGWLKRNVRKSEENRSAASGKIVRRWDYCNYFMLPKERMLTQEEALAYGEKEKISAKEAEGMTLATAGKIVGKLAFFSTEYEEGTNTNVIECPTPTQAANSYRTSPVVYSKYCAYAFWPRSCEHVYGSNAMFDSEFCINCYHSVKLKRCFEMDSSRDCAGSYYCHNCENVQDSMFCFNTKNKRYAIGNAEVGRERFLEAKKMLLGWINGQLAAKKAVALDIYDVGSARKS